MGLRIGVIGGSGLYEMESLTGVHEESLSTPYGDPSDAFVVGRMSGVKAWDGGTVELVFLPRHGRGHRFMPSEVPYRANIYAMKLLGVSWIVSVSAVGSLREDIAPGHVVVVDQFIDRTRFRPSTFFGDGVVAHMAFADPVCGALHDYLVAACREAGAVTHERGTYVCMEGPAFSTRAESHLYRSWGADVIGMTNLPEAKLAREAEISYATIAMATDYDCWHQGHDHVTVDQVLAVVHANVAMAKAIVGRTVPLVAAHPGPAPQSGAMAGTIMTAPDRIPPARREVLAPLVGRYLDSR